MSKPKGAMGSPYTNNENGEPSITSLMGNAFDRLHENSWDGGKKKKRLEKEENERIEQINNNFDKKISDEISDICNNDIIGNRQTTKFSTDIKKEMVQFLIDNDFNINEVNNEQIIFSTEVGKFIILPL